MRSRSMVVVGGLVALCWCGAGPVHAGAPAAAKPGVPDSTGSLVVVLRDADWRVPLPYASVSIVGLKRGLLTDTTGVGRFPGLPAGVVGLRVRYLGYREVRVAATIRPGARDTLGIPLRSIVPTSRPPVFITNPPYDREVRTALDSLKASRREAKR